MYVLYKHIRKDNDAIFYIGIGTEFRATQKSSRSKWWNNIVNKCGYRVEVMSKNLSWARACDLEILTIAFYGRKDLGQGYLCNMTNGGEGRPGSITSEATKAKISASLKGNTNIKGIKQSEGWIANRVEACVGKGKVVLNTETGIYYGTVREAAEAHDYLPSSLGRRLRGERINKSCLKFV